MGLLVDIRRVDRFARCIGCYAGWLLRVGRFWSVAVGQSLRVGCFESALSVSIVYCVGQLLRVGDDESVCISAAGRWHTGPGPKLTTYP